MKATREGPQTGKDVRAAVQGGVENCELISKWRDLESAGLRAREAWCFFKAMQLWRQATPPVDAACTGNFHVSTGLGEGKLRPWGSRSPEPSGPPLPIRPPLFRHALRQATPGGRGSAMLLRCGSPSPRSRVIPRFVPNGTVFPWRVTFHQQTGGKSTAWLCFVRVDAASLILN